MKKEKCAKGIKERLAVKYFVLERENVIREWRQGSRKRLAGR
jgi:hypothetical protein